MLEGVLAKPAVSRPEPFMLITPRGIERERQHLGDIVERFAGSARRIAVITRAELRSTYFGKSLGWLWLIIEPMLMALMYWFQVAVLFGLRAEETSRFVTILLLVTFWLWFSRTVLAGPSLLASYASLLRDTDFSINTALGIVCTKECAVFGFNVVVTTCFLLMYGVRPGWALIALPLVVMVQVILMLTMVMLLAVGGAFIKDLGGLLGQFITIVWYMSPALYDVRVAGERMGSWSWILQINPLYWIFPCYEKIVILNTLPDTVHIYGLMLIVLICIPLLIAGFWLFQRARYYFYYFL